jgi:hypothetical protein
MTNKNIIISSLFFGLIYLNSVSLCEINKLILNKNENYKLYLLNGFVFSYSGSILLFYSIKTIKLLNY